jgi:hypothetical protein
MEVKQIVTTLEMPEELHTKMKIYCVENKLTLKNFMVQGLLFFMDYVENKKIESGDIIIGNESEELNK